MHKLPSADNSPWTGIRCVAYRLLATGAAFVLAACGGDGDSVFTYNSYRVTGTVSGLSAPGLVLRNSGGDELAVATNASWFQFATKLAPGSGYDVTVATQPDGMSCSVTDGSGSNVRATVTNIGIACSPITYPVAGTVSGLTASGLVLQNNGTNDLTIAANATSFQFSTPVAAGGGYSITVLTQPSGSTCSVSNGAGSNVQAAVTAISIACSPITHTVAGTITGLTAGGLVIQNNGADDLVVAANATAFTFATPVASGGGYSVTALSQPSGLTCSVSNGSGTGLRSDIASVQIACSASAFSVGGTIVGLTGNGLVLQNNSGDDSSIAANAAAFAFATPVAYGGVYAVTVSTQPAGQTCSVTQGTALLTTQVTNVIVTCVNIVTYTLLPSAGTNGSIAPSSAVVVNSGDGFSFVATPDAGYAIDQWLLDGTLAQSGGAVFALTNIAANHTVAVSFAQATLTSSVATLALAMNCLPSSGCTSVQNAALSGNPRQIVVTNTGAVAATNVSIAYPTWPAGTTASSTCGSVLAPSSSCTITITPGATASSNCTSGIAPVSDIITLSADDAASNYVEAAVLGYGCIYQGGYIFSMDDTTAATQSVGGKVAALTDQSSNILWSSNGSGNVGNFAVLGVDETSTVMSPSPTSPPYAPGTPAYIACAGSTDGACNTANIVDYANFNRASGGPAPTPLEQYAAGLCKATIQSYSDWYQPAICEQGYDGIGAGSGCGTASSPTLQNMQSNLVDNGDVAGLDGGLYWSSTEYSADPQAMAWLHIFVSGGGGVQTGLSKASAVHARCARTLTP